MQVPSGKDQAHLFVYGTLLEGAGHPMHRMLAQNARLVGPAWFPGRLYDLGSYPGAVFTGENGTGESGTGENGRLVHGEIYALLREGPLLKALDRYEGCTEEDTSPALYVRERLPVHLKDGRVIEAWIYLYNRPTEGLPEIPGGHYLNRHQS